MPYPIGFFNPLLRRATGDQPGLRQLLVLGRQAQTAATLGIVQPGQSPIELLAQELLGRCRRRRHVGQELVDELFHVHAHSSTL